MTTGRHSGGFDESHWGGREPGRGRVLGWYRGVTVVLFLEEGLEPVCRRCRVGVDRRVRSRVDTEGSVTLWKRVRQTLGRGRRYTCQGDDVSVESTKMEEVLREGPETGRMAEDGVGQSNQRSLREASVRDTTCPEGPRRPLRGSRVGIGTNYRVRRLEGPHPSPSVVGPWVAPKENTGVGM